MLLFLSAESESKVAAMWIGLVYCSQPKVETRHSQLMVKI